MYRQNGLKVLNKLIKSETNCSKLENKVHTLCIVVMTNPWN